MNKFRPQDISAKYKLKHYIRTSRHENYNWQSRIKWYPAGWGFNKKVIGNQFGKLHYLARHAPMPIQKRWAKAYDIFEKKHFGSHKASVRYLNKWSCHSWL